MALAAQRAPTSAAGGCSAHGSAEAGDRATEERNEDPNTNPSPTSVHEVGLASDNRCLEVGATHSVEIAPDLEPSPPDSDHSSAASELSDLGRVTCPI